MPDGAVIPFVTYAVAVIALGVAGWRLSRSRRNAVKVLIFAIALGGAALIFWNAPEYFAFYFRFADAIYFSNWFPFAVALAAPALVRLSKSRRQRVRVALLSVLLFAASLTGTARLFGKPPVLGPAESFPDGTCRQTTSDTCSAAACVTFLKQHGIETTEQEMARLALSHEGRGTHPLGVYRVLKLKVAEAMPGSSVAYQRLSVDQLLAMNSPAIVNVGLVHKGASAEEAELTAKYQWEPGVVHSVVFLRREGDKVWISDPDLGTEDWPIEQFKLLYRGFAFYLRMP